MSGSLDVHSVSAGPPHVRALCHDLWQALEAPWYICNHLYISQGLCLEQKLQQISGIPSMTWQNTFRLISTW